MEDINYNAIWSHRTEDAKITALENEVERCGYVCLSDVYLNMQNGGHLMLEFLGKQESSELRNRNEFRWKLKCIRNEWGEEVKPGDIVTRKLTRQLRDKAGRKYRSNAINDFKRRGIYEKMFVEKREFVVDDKGCIDCSFDDAGWFLSEFGVHYKNKEPICGKREITSSPVRYKKTNQERHVWYWRYKEVPPDEYDKLPVLTKKANTRANASKSMEV